MVFTNIKNKTVDFAKIQYVFFKKVVFRKNSKIKNYKRTAIVASVMVAVMILPIFPLSTLTLAYEVKYEDNSIGYVSNESQYKEAENIVNDKFVGSFDNSLELSAAIVPSNSLNTVSEISKNLTENLAMSDSVVNAYGIYVGDKCIAASFDKLLLLNAIESYKSNVQAKNNADIVAFDKAVQIKGCLSFEEKITDLENTTDLIEQFVDYRVGYFKTDIKTLKHKTVKKDDDSLYEGLEKIKTEGSDGKQEVKTLVWYKNNKKVLSEIVEKKTVEKAKTEVILIGTKERPQVDLKGAKLLWPIAKDASCYISSGFGQRSGRLHKGIDIIANYGTEILAAADGVVTRSSWFESYGYCVDIRHSDGTLTRYAHCSKLIASVGEQVVAGQTIAKVGSTGRSTANHLHFEVRPNGGNPVNPNNYVKK